MSDSILISIKAMLGIPAADTAFDTDIMIHINSAFMALNQLGIGPTPPFNIGDDSSLWSEFTTPPEDYAAMKTYVYLRVKLLFDPPATSFILEAMKQQIDEYGWRLMIQVPIEEVTP